jgi:hypothetical protein
LIYCRYVAEESFLHLYIIFYFESLTPTITGAGMTRWL